MYSAAIVLAGFYQLAPIERLSPKEFVVRIGLGWAVLKRSWQSLLGVAGAPYEAIGRTVPSWPLLQTGRTARIRNRKFRAVMTRLLPICVNRKRATQRHCAQVLLKSAHSAQNRAQDLQLIGNVASRCL